MAACRSCDFVFFDCCFEVLISLLGVMVNGPQLGSIQPRTGVTVHNGLIDLAGNQRSAFRETAEYLSFRDDFVSIVDVQEV